MTEEVQETGKSKRHTKILNLYTLQCRVDDLISKNSAVGTRVLRKCDTGVAMLF